MEIGNCIPFWMVLRDAQNAQRYRCISENPDFDGAVLQAYDTFGDGKGVALKWLKPPAGYVKGGLVRLEANVTRAQWELVTDNGI